MLIGLGHRARSGKDTVAAYLVNKYGFYQEFFAYPLKEYIGKQICGFNEKQLYGSFKEVIDPTWGKTPREIMQLVGTNALRNIVHPDFWVIPMRKKIKAHLELGHSVVVSDCRYLNEVSLIKELDGFAVNINRANLQEISGFKNHSSEKELEDYRWDFVLNNDEGIEELYKNVDNLMLRLKNK